MELAKWGKVRPFAMRSKVGSAVGLQAAVQGGRCQQRNTDSDRVTRSVLPKEGQRRVYCWVSVST